MWVNGMVRERYPGGKAYIEGCDTYTEALRVDGDRVVVES